MNRQLLKLTCLIGMACATAMAQSTANDAGKKAERTACVACHSLRIVESQRLSPTAWEKEVDKMIGWGAVVSERKVLIDYLASEYSNAKPVPAPETSKSGVGH